MDGKEIRKIRMVRILSIYCTTDNFLPKFISEVAELANGSAVIKECFAPLGAPGTPFSFSCGLRHWLHHFVLLGLREAPGFIFPTLKWWAVIGPSILNSR
jgi:hypothetical protein